MATIFIEDLEVGHAWYSITPDGSTKISNGMSHRHKGGFVSNSACVAVALTQACCEVSTGKVYQIYRAPPRPHRQTVTAAEFQIYQAQVSVPDLIYIPEGWTEESKAKWRQMKPVDQLHHCWASHGWVNHQVAVLPFVAALPGRHRHGTTGLRLCGTSTAPVSMLVSNEGLHIGPTDDIRNVCRLIMEYDEEGKLLSHDYEIEMNTWSAMKRWRQADLKGVVQTLMRLTQDRGDLTVLFGSVMHCLHEAYRSTSMSQTRLTTSKLENKSEKTLARKAEFQKNQALRDIVQQGRRP